MIDLGYRAYAHNFQIDPIIRSLLYTDYYKFPMNQLAWKHHPDVQVTFSLINRSKQVRLADLFTEQELREQLDYVRTLRFTNNELIWLQGNTFYGKKGMFDPDYIEFLRNFQFPAYDLRPTKDGQFDLHFPGAWPETTFWEIPSVTIVNVLRIRAVLRTMGRFALDVLYAQAKSKLWWKLQRLRELEDLNLIDFATRRCHSFLFHEWAVLAARDALGDGFTGTSNAFLAMKHGFEARGTNAHERPMVAAALANSEYALRQSQYDVHKEWAEAYEPLRIMLPDTYGTSQFLHYAPDWLADWTGIRHDSKDPIIAGEEAIHWWNQRGRDPRTKLNLFTDGLDVEPIVALHQQFRGRSKVGFGIGTLLGNDFRGCHPDRLPDLDPISIICKPTTVNGVPAVKLSDNYQKRTGDPAEIARYERAFGLDGVANLPIIV